MLAARERTQGGWFIVTSFVLAGCLAMIPMPEWLDYIRPDWVLLVLVYWVLALPHRVGLGGAWLAGFFLDVLEGTLLGLNAFALTLSAYLVFGLYQRVRMFTLLQQSFTLLVLAGIYQLVIFWVLTIAEYNTATNLRFLMSAVTSALIWPFIFVVLRYFRRQLPVT